MAEKMTNEEKQRRERWKARHPQPAVERPKRKARKPRRSTGRDQVRTEEVKDAAEDTPAT